VSSLTNKHWQPFYISLVLSGLFVIAFFVLSALGYIQSIESQGIIGDASRWCERVSGGLFREPVNTLSNLGFMVVGIYIFYTITTDTNTSSNNYFVGLTGISILYASAAIFLGPGSMLMHGTNSGWGGWADNLSMIMYILIPWLYNIFRMSNWTVRRFLEIYFSIVVIYAVMRWISGWGLGINLELFSVSIGLWAISEFLFKFWSPLFRFLSGFLACYQIKNQLQQEPINGTSLEWLLTFQRSLFGQPVFLIMLYADLTLFFRLMVSGIY
jgi:hypothetical protein